LTPVASIFIENRRILAPKQRNFPKSEENIPKRLDFEGPKAYLEKYVSSLNISIYMDD